MKNSLLNEVFSNLLCRKR